MFINSIDRDGTGNGLDYEILNKIPNTFKRPIIISGGTGNYQHVLEGFKKTILMQSQLQIYLIS